MKVLVLTTDPDKSGGVANYYAVLRGRWSIPVTYFIIGARSDTESSAKTFIRLLADYVRFVRQTFRSEYDLIVFNPTLGSKAVIRDGIFLLLARLLTKSKRLVFWRGFFLDFFDRHIDGVFLPVFRSIFFGVDAHIVLGKVFRERLMRIGCDVPIYVDTTVVSSDILKKEPINIRDDSFNVLFLARVESSKGIYETLEAFRILKARIPVATLSIAGDGSELPSVRQLVFDKGIADVRFLGDVRGEKKVKIFSESDVYFFPSHFEGMPNSVLEAMAMGVPIICRSVGGLPDFFENNRMGFMTNSMDPRVFAELAENLFRNPDKRRSFSFASATYAREHFSENAVCQRLEEIFSTVVFGNREVGTK